MSRPSQPVLVSACLLGLNTRYDGRTKTNQRVLDYLKNNDLTPIPVCPEQLGGLPTPRQQTCFSEGDGVSVLDGTGEVVTLAGANENSLKVTAIFCYVLNENGTLALTKGVKACSPNPGRFSRSLSRRFDRIRLSICPWPYPT